MIRTGRRTSRLITLAAVLGLAAPGCDGQSTLVGMTISPATATVIVGQTQTLTVDGKRSDGSVQPITGAVWSASDHGVAIVSYNGVVTGVAPGSTTITAAYAGQSATARITVTGSSLTSIAVTPATVILAAGGTQALTVTGSYDDGSMAPVTATASFSSSAAAIADVSGAGVVTGVAPGSATITATLSGKTATVAVTVTAVAATLVSVAVTPNPVSLAAGGTAQLVVTGKFTSGPTQDVTANATFSTLDGGVATVGAGGLVTAVANGSTTITAKVTPQGGSAISGTTIVNVAAVVPGGKVFFAGAYDSGVAFMPFGGSTNDVTVDAATTLNATGHGSLKVVFPGAGYTGGAFVDNSAPRNLTAFDAVTFWAKASAPLTFEKVGLGNNGGFSGNTGFDVEENALALTTAWQKFSVPIPLASKLTANDGLFHFADGTNHSGGSPVTVWLADIQYEALGSGVLSAPSPAWLNTAITVANAATYQIKASDLKIDYTVNAVPLTLSVPNPNYFTFTSDNAVATITAGSLITGVNSGASAVANVTATLGTVASANKLAVTVTNGVLNAPTTLPPVPTIAAGAKVISLYSSVTGGYNGTASDKSANVDTWLTCWSAASGGDPVAITVGGSTASPRKYVLTAGATYLGVEVLGKTGATQPGSCGGTITGANELDISTMTGFHVDVWTPDDNSNLQFKLVDAGADGKLDGQETNGIATLTPGSTPPLATGKWLSYDLTFASGFPGNNFGSSAANLHHFGQLVIVAPGGGTVYVDNLYFYNAGSGGGGGSVPTTVATAPTAPAANVISLFSSTYTGGTAGGDYSARVDSFAASCFGPPGTTVADYTIAGTAHVVKQYAIAANGFAIVELIGGTGGTTSPPDSLICHGGTQTGSNLTDVSAMTTLHFDVWSPGGSTNFQVHLVNADGTSTIAGPGSASGATGGANYATGANTIGTAAWVGFDIPLSSLGLPGAPAALIKLGLIKFFTTDPGTFFVDNLYFHQ